MAMFHRVTAAMSKKPQPDDETNDDGDCTGDREPCGW